jgi:N-acylneuraminate cytidylyltransferase/CMP-N,N'-diacetyllegionaminic acid synthase
LINGKTVLAIIPARGGSKGIPQKNIKLLAGKPLIAWTLENAKKSKYIDRIIVSTDSQEIANVSLKYGAEAPFIRPRELAADETPSSEVIVHTIKWFEINRNQKFNVFILLQPTSPLRNGNQIDSALENFISNSNNKCLVSVKEVEESPYWMKIIDDDYYLKNFTLKQNNFTRRQDLPKIYILNGAIYIMTTSDFMNYKSFDVDKTVPFIMDKKSSIDIDNELDFEIAEYLFKKRNNEY